MYIGTVVLWLRATVKIPVKIDSSSSRYVASKQEPQRSQGHNVRRSSTSDPPHWQNKPRRVQNGQSHPCNNKKHHPDFSDVWIFAAFSNSHRRRPSCRDLNTTTVPLARVGEQM